MSQVHVICHTHWDREWYLTRSQFLPKLVRLIDQLLDAVEGDNDYLFMLDGQTIVIEDYLSIRPQNKSRLREAIRQGRIQVGPWYILPDEMLISGESHIRNFLIGQKIASSFGSSMVVGYLPDSFGHPAQMPQILNGLGMHELVFWRGVPNEIDHIEFNWYGPDQQSSVLCINMPFGYGNAARLIETDQKLADRLDELINKLNALSNTSVILLMNGSDHLLTEKGLPQVINAYNRSSKNKLKISRIQNYLAELKAALPDEIESYKGKIYSGDKVILLGGTISTRMPLKQKNHKVQKLMERYLEPLFASEFMSGCTYQTSDYSIAVWRRILENQPHDSICGCSVDEVHREMYTRFDTLLQFEDQLIHDSFTRLSEHMMGTKISDIPDAAFVCYEPVQDRLPEYAEIEVDFDIALMRHVDFARSIIKEEEDLNLPPPPKKLRVVDDTGREIKNEVIESYQTTRFKYSDDTLPEEYLVNRCKVALQLPGFDYGLHNLLFYKQDSDKKTQSFMTEELPFTEGQIIENEFYQLSFDQLTGSFAVLDKKTGKRHTGVNQFSDVGDAGDEYTYAWPEIDLEYTLVKTDIEDISLVSDNNKIKQSIIVQSCLRLPAQLSRDRKSRSDDLCYNSVRITASLYASIDRIDFSVELENNSEDHRLQVCFPAGVSCENSFASAAFEIACNQRSKTIPEEWQEYPQNTELTHGFVSVYDRDTGLVLMSEGMTEYEVKDKQDQSVVCLTLLRCVGWLSRSDLSTRKGNGGWTLPTPEAQCKGRHEFNYSISYRPENDAVSRQYALCDRRLHKQAFYQVFNNENLAFKMDNPASFVSQLPENLRISAFKKAEKDQSVILRFYSIADIPVYTSLKIPSQIDIVYQVDLTESHIKQHELNSDNILKLCVQPYEILSLKLIPRTLGD